MMIDPFSPTKGTQMSEENGRFHFEDPAPESAGVAPLVLLVDGQRVEYAPAELTPALAEDLRSKHQHLVAVIEDLYAWSDFQRHAVFHFIVCLGRHVSVGSSKDDSEGRSLLSTVISMIENDDSSSARTSQGRDAAMEVAILAHPHALQAACDLIDARLKELGLDDNSGLPHFEIAPNLLNHLFDPDDEAPLVDLLLDPPLPDDAQMPWGWNVRMEGVWIDRMFEGDHDEGNGGLECRSRRILRTPFLVIRRLRDSQDETESLEVAWWRDHRWNRRIVSAGTLASSDILELAAFGVPVTSHNWEELVEFVHDFIEANEDVIPCDRLTHPVG